MALQFKPGDKVRQVVHVIEGVVRDAVIIDADVQFKVVYEDADGQPHERNFTGDQIELVADPVDPAPAAS